MGLRTQLAALASRFKQEVVFYRALHAHPQTPWLAKALPESYSHPRAY